MNQREGEGKLSVPSERIRRELTRREKLFKELGTGKTPHSLQLAEEFIQLIPAKANILDIGCGSGDKLFRLVCGTDRKGLGVDINPREIMFAEQKFTSANLQFIEADGTDLTFIADNYYDCITMTGVIGAVEPEVRNDLLSESYRLLKPGGKLAIADFKLSDDSEQIRKYLEDMKETGEYGTRVIRDPAGNIIFIGTHFAKENLEGLFRNAGFSNIQIREHSITSAVLDYEAKTRQQYTVWAGKEPNVCNAEH
jgi:ubiquinone/menaquinone biosynthesis C-methylase UbiE